MKLLLIESDAKAARALHEQWLNYRSIVWELTHVTHVAEGLAQLQSYAGYDAVLLSVRTAEELKMCFQFASIAPRIPTIVLSPFDRDLDAVRAMELGAEDYLVSTHRDGLAIMRRLRFAIERAKARGAEALPHPREFESAEARLPLMAVGAVADCSVDDVGAETSECWTQSRWTSPASWGSPQLEQDGALAAQPTLAGDIERATLRVLHVEDDRAVRSMVETMLDSYGLVDYQVTGCESVEKAVEYLSQATVDVVLIDMSVVDRQGLETVNFILPHAGSADAVILTCQEDEATAIRCLQMGATDYLYKTELRAEKIGRTLHIGHLRKAQTHYQELIPWRQTLAADGSRIGCDRRRHARYNLTKPIFVVPVLPGNRPDAAHLMDGYSNDISVGGISIEIPPQQRLPGRRLVIGVERDDGQADYATVYVRSMDSLAARIRLSCAFVPPHDDVLREPNLMPTLDLRTCRLKPQLPADVLHAWEQVGVLRRVLVNRAYTCPECGGLPTFRTGCPNCGSARLSSSRLIHHFACAHVGFVADFEEVNELVCPKCRARGMIVGSDFEYLNGPVRCGECDWSDSTPATVGQCLTCELQFPMQRAREEDLIGYHVDRLDPLALVDSH